MIFYSKTTRGFYSSRIHGRNIPDDAAEITQETHVALLAAQASGKIIVPGPDGSPIAVDRPSPSPLEVAQATLRTLDPVLPRCVEDLIAALSIDESTLPEIMQERLAQKRAAREVMRNA